MVYLDTAEFSKLEAAWKCDAALFDNFARAWSASGAQAVVSLASAREIAGIRDAARRSDRLAAMRELGPPLVTHDFSDAVAVREGEIFVRHNGETSAQQAARVRSSLFIRGTHEAVLGLVDEYVEIEARVLEAEALSADAQNTHGPSKMWRLPKGIPPGVDIEQMASSARAAGVEQGLDSAQLDELEAMARAIGDSVLGAGGLRPGLVNHFGLAGFEHIARAPDSDLSILSVFAEQVRERLAGIPDAESRLRHVDFFSLPALSLELAYHRALAADGITKTPSAGRDRDHLAFAPYVDLITVDKRTFAYLEQESRHRRDLLPLGVPKSVYRVGDVSGIVEAIRACSSNS